MISGVRDFEKEPRTHHGCSLPADYLWGSFVTHSFLSMMRDERTPKDVWAAGMALDRTETCVGEIFSKGIRRERNENPWSQKQSQTQLIRVKQNELLLLCVKVDLEDTSSSHHTAKRLFLSYKQWEKMGRGTNPTFPKSSRARASVYTA